MASVAPENASVVNSVEDLLKKLFKRDSLTLEIVESEVKNIIVCQSLSLRQILLAKLEVLDKGIPIQSAEEERIEQLPHNTKKKQLLQIFKKNKKLLLEYHESVFDQLIDHDEDVLMKCSTILAKATMYLSRDTLEVEDGEDTEDKQILRKSKDLCQKIFDMLDENDLSDAKDLTAKANLLSFICQSKSMEGKEKTLKDLMNADAEVSQKEVVKYQLNLVSLEALENAVKLWDCVLSSNPKNSFMDTNSTMDSIETTANLLRLHQHPQQLLASQLLYNLSKSLKDYSKMYLSISLMIDYYLDIGQIESAFSLIVWFEKDIGTDDSILQKEYGYFQYIIRKCHVLLAKDWIDPAAQLLGEVGEAKNKNSLEGLQIKAQIYVIASKLNAFLQTEGVQKEVTLPDGSNLKTTNFGNQFECLYKALMFYEDIFEEMESNCETSNKGPRKWAYLYDWYQCCTLLAKWYIRCGISVEAKLYLEDALETSETHGWRTRICEITLELDNLALLRGDANENYLHSVQLLLCDTTKDITLTLLKSKKSPDKCNPPSCWGPSFSDNVPSCDAKRDFCQNLFVTRLQLCTIIADCEKRLSKQKGLDYVTDFLDKVDGWRWRLTILAEEMLYKCNKDAHLKQVCAKMFHGGKVFSDLSSKIEDLKIKVALSNAKNHGNMLPKSISLLGPFDSIEAKSLKLFYQVHLPGKQCKNGLRAKLEELFDLIKLDPPCVPYRNVCHSLALVSLDENKYTEAAYYFTEASSVFLRYVTLKNILDRGNKLETTQRKFIFFDRKEWSDMINKLPKDWTICQISMVSNPGKDQNQLFVSRISKTSPPMVFPLLCMTSEKLKVQFNLWTNVMKLNDDMLIELQINENKVNKSLNQHEKTRKTINELMMDCLSQIQNEWFAGYIGCLFGKLLNDEDENKLQEQVESFMTLSHVAKKHRKLIEIIMTAGHLMKYNTILDVLFNFTERKRYTSLIMTKLNKLKLENCNRGPVILILDKDIQHLPLESIPWLEKQTFTRHLSFQCLMRHFCSLSKNSVINKGLDNNKVFYVLDPSNNLSADTIDSFRKEFKKNKGWIGVINREPTIEEFKKNLESKDLFLFIGHDDCSDHLPAENLEQFNCRTAVVLFGCSSGRLITYGQFEPVGMMIKYILAGTPWVLGSNLYTTDHVLDNITCKFLNEWLLLNTKKKKVPTATLR